MKKLTALISALSLLLVLCACSDPGAAGPESEEVSLEPASTQAVSEGPAQSTAPSGEPSAAPTEEIETPEPGEGSEPPSDAVSEAPAVTSTPAPAASQAPAATSTPAVAPDPTPTAEPDPTLEPTPAADPKAVARGLIGHPVSELYAAIGRPLSSDYAPGCVEPDSEDGELIYSGFTVYTVRTASREYVYDVL